MTRRDDLMTQKPTYLNFIVVIEDRPPSPDFSLKNLPSASKIDVVARNILALFPNHEPNLIITYYAFFTKDSPKALVVNQIANDYELPDEINVASQIKTTFATPSPERMYWESFPNFKAFLEQTIVKSNHSIFYLKEDGANYIPYFSPQLLEQRNTFILGGRKDLSDENEEILLTYAVEKISLGKNPYLASQCLSLITYEFEKLLSKKQ